MVYTFEVSDSNNKNKKLKVVIYKDGIKVKTLHIGDNRYADYIQYYRSSPSIADERKRFFLLRHHKENWRDFMKPAFWSRWLLWEKKTLREAIANINLNR
jgi:hypothetical protein